MRWLWLAALLAGCGAAAPSAVRPTAVRPSAVRQTAGRPTACDRSPGPAQVVPPAQLGAIHFLTPTVGVGLTAPQIPCGAGFRRGPVLLAVTQDGGRIWVTQGLPLPAPASASALGEQITAISPQTVWASTGAGPLVATTTGGRDWTVQPVPGSVAALTITRRTLWTLGCPHPNNVACRPVLAHTRLPAGPWRKISVSPPVATPGAELAVRGLAIIIAPGPAGDVRLLISTDGGRRWRVTRPDWMGRPCWGGFLATAGPADWWVICLGGAAAGSSEKALLHTADAGRTWRVASQVTSLTAPLVPGGLSRGEPNALAAGSRTRLWLAFQNWMTESEDAGARWTSVPPVNPQGMPSAFDVLSPTHAWLLAPGQGLWRTTDGRHWRAL